MHKMFEFSILRLPKLVFQSLVRFGDKTRTESLCVSARRLPKLVFQFLVGFGDETRTESLFVTVPRRENRESLHHAGILRFDLDTIRLPPSSLMMLGWLWRNLSLQGIIILHTLLWPQRSRLTHSPLTLKHSPAYQVCTIYLISFFCHPETKIP